MVSIIDRLTPEEPIDPKRIGSNKKEFNRSLINTIFVLEGERVKNNSICDQTHQKELKSTEAKSLYRGGSRIFSRGGADFQ